MAVSFAAEVYTAAEGGAAGEVTVRLDIEPERTVEIPLTAQGEAGAQATDWSGVPSALTFAPNEREKRFSVRAANDSEDDDGERLVLGFGQPLPPRVSQGTPSSATVTLVDDDDPAVEVWLDAPGGGAAESGATVEVAMRLSAAPERALEVPLTARGIDGATAADWTVPASLSFLPDETEARFAVRATDDAVDDDGESVEIGFGRLPSRVSATSPSSVVIALEDDDQRGVDVSTTSLAVQEGGSASYTVRLLSEPTSSVTVRLTEQPENRDIRADKSTLRFTADNWGEPQAVTVTAAEDSDALTDETTLEHRVSGGDYGAVTADSVSVAVAENEVPVLTIADADGGEGETMTFAVQLSLAAGVNVTVDYATTDGTAQAGTDYGHTAGTLIVPAGTTTADILVTVFDDTDDEPEETYRVQLSGATGATLAGGRPTATGTIRDDDGRPGMPRDLSAATTGTSSIELSWREPDDTGDTPIIGYLLEWSADHESADWRVLDQQLEPTVSTYADVGTQDAPLGPGTTRYYRVAAANAAGPGPYAGPVEGVTALLGGPVSSGGSGSGGSGGTGGTGGTGGGGGGGGGGAANIPPVVEREIPDQTVEAGAVLELDITLNFYDRNQRALDYTVASDNPAVATVTVNRQGVLTIRGVAAGVAAITVTAADRRDERAADTFLVRVTGPLTVPLFPAAADPVRQGFARVINHDEAGEVSVVAIDDAGARHGPVTLFLDAGETQHFNSADLEDGNAAKGLSEGVGPGTGDWRLELTSDLDIEVLAYIRTEDGFLTAMHDLAPGTEGGRRVAVFNPGSNPNQVSRLRLINPGEEAAEVTITGIDDAGESPGGTVTLSLPPGTARTVSSAALEAGGEGLDGALGDGAGKWRLAVESESPVLVMSLLESPTGHLTNLSTVSVAPPAGIHAVPLFPSAADPVRQGFARVINHGEAGEVSVVAIDDSGARHGPVTLFLDAGETQHFNSGDLEGGNAVKGLPEGVGSGAGDWRLELTSDLDIEALAYIRAGDGFLTAMHDLAPGAESRRRVAVFNPGSNPNQVSRLRLINPGEEAAEVTITGIDDAGESPGGTVTLSLPPGAARTVSSAALEAGGEDLDGALGDGAGKWRLAVESESPVQVMSLLESPTGHLTNLSTAPGRGAGVDRS